MCGGGDFGVGIIEMVLEGLDGGLGADRFGISEKAGGVEADGG